MKRKETIRFNLRVTLLGLLYICSLASCNTARHAFNYKEIPCDFDFSIKEEDKTLDITKYIIDKVYENNSYTIMVSDLFGDEYVKFIHHKDSGIDQTIGYNSKGKIQTTYYRYMEANIGKSYEFDEQGNVIEEKNEDEGYQICWAQAMAIGKNYARKDMHEEEPELVIAKKKKGNRLYWSFIYDDKKKRTKQVEIDGVTGKIVRVLNVFIEI